MKHLIAAVALATLIASPAMAQSWNPSVGSGNTVPAPYGLTENGYNKLNGVDTFAQAPRHHVMSRRSHADNEPGYSQPQREGQGF
jgi:hypothetical protein